MDAHTDPPPPSVVGRYAIYGEIASGGMATVHVGRLLGGAGFSRTVAVKRLHPQFARDPDFVSMLLDEARLASRIRHPNVVSTLDVVASGGELFLVMEYVQGESLSRLVRAAKQKGERIPIPIALTIIAGVLQGLHAAHEARSEAGELLGIVHRDVSPQNVLVGADGVPQVIDFGVAKAAGRLQTTRDGVIKGKIQYMAPEQIEGEAIDRRADIYAASVVLWELLAGRRLFQAEGDRAVLGQIYAKIVQGAVDPPSMHTPGLPKSIDAIVLKGLAAKPEQRYATARDMLVAIESTAVLATARSVGEWVERVAGEALQQKASRVSEIESVSSRSEIPAFRSGDFSSAPGAHIVGVPTPPPQERSASSSLHSAPNAISVSLGESVPDLPRPRRAMSLAVAAVLLCIVIGASTIWVVFRRSHVAASSPAGGPSPQPTTSLSAPPALIEPQVLDASDQPPLATPAPVSASASARAPVVPPRPKPSARPAPPVGCDPPYSVDPSGVKRYKPECVR